MRSNRRLLLSVEAVADLTDIWHFTASTWGDAQADGYVERVRARLDELVRFPGLGKARDEIAMGLRGLPVERHVPFYVVRPDSIVVRRILHPSRDFEDELQR
jgi:toxin ParE1/3/4